MGSCVTEVQLRELEWKTRGPLKGTVTFFRVYVHVVTAFTTLSKYRKLCVALLVISFDFQLDF